MPLRANPLQYDRLRGPGIVMFGRLKDSVTIEQAQAELDIIGARAAAAVPATHARLRPLVVPYTHQHVDLTQPGLVFLLRLAQLLVGAVSFVRQPRDCRLRAHGDAAR